MFCTSYFIDVDTFYLFLNWFSTRVSDDRKYVCGRRLYAYILKYTKIQGPRFQRNYIIANHCQRSKTWFTYCTSFQSSPKLNPMLITRPFAYNESLQHPTIIFFFPTTQKCSLVPKQSTLSSDRICGPTRFRKALNLILPKLSSQNMGGFNHATILRPTFHGLRKERLAQWAPICVQNTTKNALPIISLAAYASATKYPLSL